MRLLIYFIENVERCDPILRQFSGQHDKHQKSHGCSSSPIHLHGTPSLTQTHYLFQILRLIKGAKESGERLSDLGRRMFLLGLACLFSLNFLQGTIMGSIMAWGVLILMIVAHCFAFLRETGQKYHNISLLVFYSMLLLWFSSEALFFVIDAF